MEKLWLLIGKTWERVRLWLTPSNLKSDEEVRRVYLFINVLIAILLTNLVALAMTFLDENNDPVKTAISSGAILVVLFILSLIVKIGKIRLAEWTLSLLLWIHLALMMIFLGGLHSQIPAIFIVIIMFVGASMGKRYAILFSLFTVSFFGLIAFLEFYQLLPPTKADMMSPVNAWVCLSVAFPLTAVLLYNLLRTIRISSERYKLAVDGSSACIWDWNVLTQEMHFSQSFQTLLGYSRDEVPCTLDGFTKLFHEDDRQVTCQKMSNHFANPNYKFNVEFRVRTKGGDYLWLQCKGEALRNSRSEVERMVGCLCAINERKLAEQQLALQHAELIKTNSELDRFVYSASHDLRAPIASLLGLVNLLRTEKDYQCILEICAMQEKCLIKLDRFIRDITNYSANIRTNVRASKIEFDDLFSRVDDQLDFLSSNATVQMTRQIPPNLDFYSDASRVEIIVRNLVSNSIKYSDKNKELPFIKTIICAQENGILIRVIDNGDGIQVEHIDHICEMFYRASQRGSGSGIGLYIVKEAVEKLNGKLFISSVYTQGTEVTIYLPNLKHLQNDLVSTSPNPMQNGVGILSSDENKNQEVK